jgi:arylsulfatase A-like enzyme
MKGTSALVLVIDRLGAAWLGPYGNTWLDTPNFNRLAAQSVLCETALADSPDLAAVCRSYWTGRHALEPVHDDGNSVLRLATVAGKTSLLLTDDPQVFDHPLTAGFSDRRITPAPANTSSAESIEQSELFAFFDAARAALHEPTRPDIMWLHARGMNGPWDAPLELRYQFADEDDPDPPHFIDPPELKLGDNFDPDQQLGFVQAYAGQVVLLDMCLGLLLDAIDEHPLWRDALLVVTSPRGYPLGEHNRIGACDSALYGELLHVPCFIRIPGNEHALTRVRSILQPHDIAALVVESCGGNLAGEQRASRLLGELRGKGEGPNVACAIGPGQSAIRTPAWFMRQSRSIDEPRQELFAKPDDRWEANEVSSRCSDAVELLAAELERFTAAARAGHLAEAAPLAELLCDTYR